MLFFCEWDNSTEKVELLSFDYSWHSVFGQSYSRFASGHTEKVINVHQSHGSFECLIQVCKPSYLCGSNEGWVLFKITIKQDFYVIRTAHCLRRVAKWTAAEQEKNSRTPYSPILMIILPVPWNNWNTGIQTIITTITEVTGIQMFSFLKVNSEKLDNEVWLFWIQWIV